LRFYDYDYEKEDEEEEEGGGLGGLACVVVGRRESGRRRGMDREPFPEGTCGSKLREVNSADNFRMHRIRAACQK
jgi:hypothetical protein